MLQKVINSRFVSVLVFFVLYWIVAAASTSGSLGKWALRDGNEEFGVEQILDEQAVRPFAYRRLIPEAADLAERIVPKPVKTYVVDKLSPHRTFTRATAAANSRYAFRYVVISYLCFGASLLTLFLLSALLNDLGLGYYKATLAPIAFVLAFPFVQTIGGYFYDSVELFFLSAAALAAIRGRWIFLIALSIPATLNKEAFFFFAISLYPLLLIRCSRRTALISIVAMVVISGGVNAWVKWLYIDAGGGVVSFQLLNNLEKYFNFSTYAQLEVTYGIVGPSGAFLGTLLVVGIIAARGWQSCPKVVRHHLLIAAMLNLPLFVMFCAPGELRNLSLLFVGFVVLIASAIGSQRSSLSTTHELATNDIASPVSPSVS
jgi:hypothetical protein